MQDRQARNKDPFTGKPFPATISDEEGGGEVPAADAAFESRQKRRWAATILNSAELLQLHALARNDSVPGTRQHFTKILCGYEDSPRSGEKRAAAAAKKEKEKEKKPISKVTGAFEL